MDKEKIHYSRMTVTNLSGRDLLNAIRLSVREEVQKEFKKQKQKGGKDAN